ncbi:hypothetical protein EBF03_06910 [Arcanobacterium haemolyticum]|uniref:Uncharacterized protein n=1 Tax=Arcanobacterium haemolyticum (strain ATCC 9345 / DSM 20595 / CCM 5947 / CCUG 17215 / LMG 16163 / NBRC 15585 / NCTC 8452 / 11018) TaxID=644284 RepID=D7BKC7_ARCHD|nr:hypothetical protein [Arcanobacterium haemolyticum]ADH93107.1 hypothetical protein Arch_1405 [Arcanobacterium haemolyticum DSM 20595]QCX47167.1 hypothetical protein EBF03_06910 [Arcanobacterium haemolyticum]SQH28135.1 Uncharacterised protein [Arcanobacterium haemolyticum]
MENNVITSSKIPMRQSQQFYFGFILALFSVPLFFTVILPLSAIIVSRKERQANPESLPSAGGLYLGIFTLIPGLILAGVILFRLLSALVYPGY